ncbi:hypothetical protein [Mycetocola sp.]|uniref:hypothetical protein n=1 Tax=Mycetocola sp. TaxID=1871042 RepID=UPI00398A02AB
MWLTFLPDLLVAVIGAALTVVIALATFMVQRRRTEDGLLRGLIDDINRRRAFTPIEEVQSVPDAKELPDFHRVSRSVLALRDEIKRTRDGIRGDRQVQRALTEMTRACNRYLEDSDIDPDNYWHHLMTARELLDESIQKIAKSSNVEALAPGEAAY